MPSQQKGTHEIFDRSIEKQNRDLIRKTIELTELKGQLEDKNFELELANKQIKKNLETKTQFLNQAAHDLGTPLTPILTLLPIIKSNVSNPKVLEQIGVVENNAKYLSNIVRELVNLIRTEAKELEYDFRKLSLRSMINEILKNNKVVLSHNSIKPMVDMSENLPMIEGDKHKLIELFENLVSNAMKFMPKGGNLKISAKQNSGSIIVSVKDTGIGMSKKTLSRIFVEFFKADESRHYPGVGLGLSICKRIAQGHNGKIWAESKGMGKGTTIFLELPIKNIRTI